MRGYDPACKPCEAKIHPSFKIKSGDSFTDVARRKRKLLQTEKSDENALKYILDGSNRMVQFDLVD